MCVALDCKSDSRQGKAQVFTWRYNFISMVFINFQGKKI